jgi:hypothetical protein
VLFLVAPHAKQIAFVSFTLHPLKPHVIAMRNLKVFFIGVSMMKRIGSRYRFLVSAQKAFASFMFNQSQFNSLPIPYDLLYSPVLLIFFPFRFTHLKTAF